MKFDRRRITLQSLRSVWVVAGLIALGLARPATAAEWQPLKTETDASGKPLALWSVATYPAPVYHDGAFDVWVRRVAADGSQTDLMRDTYDCRARIRIATMVHWRFGDRFFAGKSLGGITYTVEEMGSASSPEQAALDFVCAGERAWREDR